jgi:hypothetical protein
MPARTEPVPIETLARRPVRSPADSPTAIPADDPRPPNAARRIAGPLRRLAPIGAAAAAAALILAAFLMPTSEPPGSSSPTSPPIAAVPASPRASADTSATSSQPLADRTLPPTGAGEAGRLETTGQHLAVWEDAFGAVRAEVVVTLRNTGGSPVEVALSTATWTVVDDAGEEVASGRFAHAFPPVVEPGGEAYLVDGVSAAFAEADELTQLEVRVLGQSAGERDAPVPLEVKNLDWSPTEDGGVTVSGQVENASTEAVREASVAVLLRNDSGEILAAVYDVAIGPLAAGDSRPFDTAYPGTPPVDPAEVAAADAVASGERSRTANAE